MTKSMLPAIICLMSILGCTQAATYLQVYKDTAATPIANVSLDDSQLVIKLTQILQDPANIDYRIIWYAFGYLGSPSGDVSNVALTSSIVLKVIFIMIDWSRDATGGVLALVNKALGLPDAMINAKKIARKVGQLIVSLISAGVDVIRMILIGFSLGAHLVGEIGTTTLESGISMPRIIGLDTGNGATALTPLPSLNPSCAIFVLHIRANPGQYGTSSYLGHANIVLNDQTSPTQKNCEPIILPTFEQANHCSHDRAPLCFFESILTGSIVAVGAVDGTLWASGNTTGPIIVAGLDTDITARGKFYCTTEGASPFGRYQAGIYPD